MNQSDVRSKPTSEWALAAWCVVATSGAYFCMYAFRKPFTAASYEGLPLWGMDYKSVLVIAQVFGYMLSKFIGIKVVAELPPRYRAFLLVALVCAAELALFGFGLTPAPYNLVFLFLNGLPLGMVFGLVLGFLEGRRNTEALAAFLCVSFIVASGVVKSCGAGVLSWGVSQFWMPFVTGLFFLPPLFFFVWMLSRIPAPNDHDIQARTERVTMDRSARKSLIRRYAFGLIVLTVVYLLITIIRTVRDDFAPEIWRGLQVYVDDSVYARSETIVGICVALVFLTATYITNNRFAFFYGMGLALFGAILLVATLVAQHLGQLSPFVFMVLAGLGLYFPYIAVHTIIFERFIAMTRDRGTIGFLMNFVDAYGYLGYVLVLLVRKIVTPSANFLPFFLTLSWAISIACIALLLPCCWYFYFHPATRNSEGTVPKAQSLAAEVA